MEVISRQGDPMLAEVFVARFRGRERLCAEFVDVRDPAQPLAEKWVIIISTQFGCPLRCPMCDAGGHYEGDLTADEMLMQIDHVVTRHPRERLRARKFKIQFARMGDPALNPAVLEALAQLPARYDAPGLMPCIATTAPRAAVEWLHELKKLRHGRYAGRPFQFQCSINSTDEAARDALMPAPRLSLEELAEYCAQFHSEGQRKVALNFALIRGVPVDPDIIARHFSPSNTCIKLTPLNPTLRARAHGMETAMDAAPSSEVEELCRRIRKKGFEVIVSIGDLRENAIGSNCGMAVMRMMTDA